MQTLDEALIYKLAITLHTDTQDVHTVQSTPCVFNCCSLVALEEVVVWLQQ